LPAARSSALPWSPSASAHHLPKRVLREFIREMVHFSLDRILGLLPEEAPGYPGPSRLFRGRFPRVPICRAVPRVPDALAHNVAIIDHAGVVDLGPDFHLVFVVF